MKRIITILLVSFTALFFTACGGGGGGDSTPPPAPVVIEVNLIGTWDYQTLTKNSPCDGLLAQGIKVVESMDGDTSKTGDTLVQGTTFALDANQECYLTSIDEVVTETYGLPSTVTAEEYLALLYDAAAGDNTITSISVDSFNDSKIQKSYEFTSGVIVTEVLTR